MIVRVVLRIPATVYAYYDCECISRDQIVALLADQEGIDRLVTDPASVEAGADLQSFEIDEDANWRVEEISRAF